MPDFVPPSRKEKRSCDTTCKHLGKHQCACEMSVCLHICLSVQTPGDAAKGGGFISNLKWCHVTILPPSQTLCKLTYAFYALVSLTSCMRKTQNK